MIRGTTPKHTFTLPFDTSMCSSIRVLYTQVDKDISVKKTLEHCELEGNIVSVKLTQEDTLSFEEGFVEVQLRILTITGDAMASETKRIRVEKLLEDEVIT